MKMETGGEFIGTRYHIKVIDTMQHASNKKVKRLRCAFTTDQVNYLEKQFKKSPFIGNAQRKEVAETLNIQERAVKIWFQNRRMKEKKEGTIEDLDSKQVIRKHQECIRNNNYNVRMPSANEKPRSLPLIANLNLGNSNNNTQIETNTSTSNIKRQTVQDVENIDSVAKTTAPDTLHVVTTANSDLVIHPPAVFLKNNHLSPDKTSAKFSIDLCKKYNSEYYAKSSHLEQQIFKKDFKIVKKMEEPMSVGFTEQMTPEDLSQNRKMNISAMGPQQTVPEITSNNSGVVPLVPTGSPIYTQPSLTTGGVVWSVMPVATSSSSPFSAPSNPLLNMYPFQEHFAKRSCNCDCHLRQEMPQIPFNFLQQTPSPQYIITAVPFQNPTTKM